MLQGGEGKRCIVKKTILTTIMETGSYIPPLNSGQLVWLPETGVAANV